ncbi:MAG: NF038143 family protein [Nitrospirota bacterium]|nr:MAG: NF038143 family protein [Nitrospirota bacterium]
MDTEYLIEEKKEMIREQEEIFASTLSLRVLEKPKLSIWMILIPIIFVYYFFQYSKFSDARRQFIEHYLQSRKLALKEAARAVTEGREPDSGLINPESDMPAEVRPHHMQVMMLLAEHYEGLLKESGGDFASLVRGAYGDLTELLIFFNNLNNAEREVNKALLPHLEVTHEGVEAAMKRIEEGSADLRREMAEDIFSGK